MADIKGTNVKGERLQGTNEDDFIVGERGPDQLIGNAGDDRLDGQKGSDRLIGGAGNDQLLGKDGLDTLNGGKGDDVLSGGQGDDVLNGGAGRDFLRGGQGADIFKFDAVDFTVGRKDADVILDFKQGTDKVQVEGYTLGTSTFTQNGRILDFDVDGDGSTDLTVKISSSVSFAESDLRIR